MKVSNSEAPDLPPNYSKSLNKMLKKLLTKDQHKRPSITEVLSFLEVRKACKRLLESRPQIYANIISEQFKKKPILELDYEDSDEEKREMDIINKKFHLHQDISRIMRSQKLIPVNAQSTFYQTIHLRKPFRVFRIRRKTRKRRITRFCRLSNKWRPRPFRRLRTTATRKKSTYLTRKSKGTWESISPKKTCIARNKPKISRSPTPTSKNPTKPSHLS